MRNAGPPASIDSRIGPPRKVSKSGRLLGIKEAAHDQISILGERGVHRATLPAEGGASNEITAVFASRGKADALSFCAHDRDAQGGRIGVVATARTIRQGD
jgi:hypothetical protein